MVAADPWLVPPEWVAERLGQPGLVLLEVDEEAAVHHVSHVPGSTFVDWQDARRALLQAGPASTAAFEQLMSLRGVQAEDDVVLFGDSANRYACGVLWLMRHHGHRSLRLMDGGRPAWLARGLPMTQEETVRRPTTYRVGAPDPSVRATRDDLLRQLSAPAAEDVVVDCRTTEEFAGLSSGPDWASADLWAERGHVPGAVSLPAGDLVDRDGALLPRPELARVAAEAGLRPDHRITAYCHTSDRSCLAWFALHGVLGFPSVRVYDGGWREYGHLLGVPVSGAEDLPG